MENTWVPVKNPNIVMRQDEKEALLFNPEDGSLLCINQTGIDIWGFCDGKNTKQEILEKINYEYEVISLDKTGQDLDAFLSELKKAGFLGVKI